MSWNLARPFFRVHAEAQGYEAWPDGFAFDNIPANILEKAYHLQMGPISNNSNNQVHLETRQAVTLRLFKKGFTDSAAAIDSIIEDAQAIVLASVKPSARQDYPSLHDVVFEDLNPDPLDGSNDNAVVCVINFNLRIILAAC